MGSLSAEITDARRRYAWDRREVSKGPLRHRDFESNLTTHAALTSILLFPGMVHDFRSDEFDEQVDQYEFAIASLLLLGKITADDLAPIMDKFRALAGPKGFIDVIKETEIEEKGEVLEKLGNRASARKFNDAEVASVAEDEESNSSFDENA